MRFRLPGYKRTNNLCLALILFLYSAHLAICQTMVKYETFEIKMSQGGWSMGAGSPSTLINGSNSYVLQMGFFAAGFNSVSPAQRLNNNLQTDSYYFSTSATAPYNPTLNANPAGLVVWFIHMKSGQVGVQPGGLTGSRQGMGVVLASSVLPNSLTAGNRYAVVYGDAADASSANGKLQLVVINDLSDYTTRSVICSTAGTLSSLLGTVSDSHFAIKVTYNPATNEWALYARNDGASFLGPLDPSPYTQVGSSAVEGTHTAVPLNYMAYVTNSSSSADRFYFDSYYVFTGIACTPGTPAISITSFAQSMAGNPMMAGKAKCSTTDRTQFYELFGTNLTSNITVTPPAGIEVSTNDQSGFTTSPLTVTQSGGNVQTKIYARASGAAAVTGTIANSSAGATTKNITVTEVVLGSLTGSNVSINCNDPAVAVSVDLRGAGTTLTGQLDPYNDSRAYTVTSGMANNTSTCGFQSGTVGIRNYTAQEFQVSATGTYTFTMRTSTPLDGAGYITSAAFTPGSCGSGTWITGADNAAGGAEPVLGPVTLTAGVNYTLYTTTGGAPATQGNYCVPFTYIWDITAPAGEQILVPFITCGNTITGNLSAYHTGSAAVQVDNYATRVTGMNNSTTCSFTASTNHNYVTQDFEVDVSGSYTFTMQPNSNYDGQGYIVSHSPQVANAGFTFGSCAGGGTFVQGDDANGEATISNVNLTAGTLYTLVSSVKGAEVANNGTFSGPVVWTVSGPGTVAIPGSGIVQWYTVPVGGTPIATGARLMPVGLDPALPNTSSPGTWIYYAAFSSSPDCRTPISFTIVCTLPVELLSFSGKKAGKANLLQWSTASETNNDFFTLEKSKNGIDWSIVKTVSGAGNSTSLMNYRLTDYEPVFPLTYYRLKQTDFDGSFTYSKVIALESTGEGVNIISSLHPNPAKDFFSFTTGEDIYERELSITIYNYLGEQVLSDKLSVVASGQNFTVKTDILPAGIYNVVFQSYSQMQSMKLVIRK